MFSITNILTASQWKKAIPPQKNATSQFSTTEIRSCYDAKATVKVLKVINSNKTHFSMPLPDRNSIIELALANSTLVLKGELPNSGKESPDSKYYKTAIKATYAENAKKAAEEANEVAKEKALERIAPLFQTPDRSSENAPIDLQTEEIALKLTSENTTKQKKSIYSPSIMKSIMPINQKEVSSTLLKVTNTEGKRSSFIMALPYQNSVMLRGLEMRRGDWNSKTPNLLELPSDSFDPIPNTGTQIPFVADYIKAVDIINAAKAAREATEEAALEAVAPLFQTPH